MVKITPLSNTTDLSTPRRVMKYMLVWCTEGQVVLIVDDKELQIGPNEVLTITSGQYHYFKRLEHAGGYILEFTLGFFCKDQNDIELIFHNGLFCHFGLNEVIPVSKPAFIDTQLQLIADEIRQAPYQHLVSIHARIKLILVAINREKVERGDEIWKPEALFLQFLEAVRGNMQRNLSVADFATLLATTEARLNEQAKKHAGKTAQNVIQGLLASEAKRLLTYEALSVKEIAFQLGFNDPFYFSNFFKKHTGVSPSGYQDQFKYIGT